MKNIIFAMVMMFCALNINAQVVRNGNTFVQTSSRSTSKDTLVTKFNYEDSKGTTYKIIINRGSGRCYVWKKSGKTGKMYKQYMTEEVSRQISKEYNINYAPKKQK